MPQHPNDDLPVTPASLKRQRRRRRCTKDSDSNSDDDDGSDSDHDSAGSCEAEHPRRCRRGWDGAALRSDPDMERRLLEVVRPKLMPEAGARRLPRWPAA